jgi:hypothetical protein
MQHMLRMQIIGLALVSALVMSALAVGSASATVLPHEWLIGGKLLASPVKVHSRGLLLLTDHNPTGGETVVHCFGFNSGTVGPHALDSIETITAELLGTNKKITCAFDPGKNGGCETGTAPTAEAVNLSWHTELYLVGTEVRDMITSGGAGNPGWAVTCKTILGNMTDTCTAALGSTKVENVAAGVLALFDANSQNADCKLGGGALRVGQGLVRGDVTIESPGGGAGEKLTFE